MLIGGLPGALGPNLNRTIPVAFWLVMVIQICLLLYCWTSGTDFRLSEGASRVLHGTTLLLMVGMLVVRWMDHQARSRKSKEESIKLKVMMSMFSNVKHQLNNDMQVVMGNAELAQILMDSNSDLKKPVNNIASAASDAIERIEQLAIFTNAGAASVKAVDLNAILRECMARLASEVPAIVTLRLDLDTVRTRVMADRYLMSLSLSHLVRETSKLMPHGGELIVKTRDFSDRKDGVSSFVRMEIYVIRAISNPMISGTSGISDIAERTRLQSSLSLTKALAERCGASSVSVSSTSEQSIVSMTFGSETSIPAASKLQSFEQLLSN